MGIFDDMSKVLNPHAEKLNNTIHLQGALLHTRLGSIEKALSDLGRPDSGDLWTDLGINAKLSAKEPRELTTVQMNETLLVQAIAAFCPNIKTVKSIFIRANGRLRARINVEPEATGLLTPGGDIAFLPGELITAEFQGEGEAELTVTCIRRGLQVRPTSANTGVSGELDASMNTHDPARDIIASRTGGYSELPPEVRDTGGSPPLIHPGRS